MTSSVRCHIYRRDTQEFLGTAEGETRDSAIEAAVLDLLAKRALPFGVGLLAVVDAPPVPVSIVIDVTASP